jgi:hypothetical protein
MDGHADVFGADRVVVGVQLQATGDPAQAPVQAREHGLEIAQQHGGEVAYRQARLEHVLGHQAQATALDLPGQRLLGRDQGTGLQAAPGKFQVRAETGGNFLAAATQFTHAVQEQQLRGTRAFGTVEQHVVKARDHRGECLPQHRQRGFARECQQALVAATVGGRNGVGHHARKNPGPRGRDTRWKTECDADAVPLVPLGDGR